MNYDVLKNIGLFDLDSSLAGYDERLIEDMERLRAPEEPPFDIRSVWGEQVPPHLKARERMIKSQVGWWANLPLIRSGYEVLRLANNLGYDCRVLTKGPKYNKNAWGEKLQWCQEKLAEVPVTVTVTGNKDNAYGKFLYDDFPPYAEAWLKYRLRGWVIMPENPHNAGFEHPRVLKHDGTPDSFVRVSELLHALREREPGRELDQKLIDRIRQR